MACFETAKKERFSLLLLEPGEIYFEDFAVYFYPNDVPEYEAMQRRQKGRLKVCSRSLIFDPSDITRPILKFPLRDCSIIEQWKGSLMSKLDKGGVLKVASNQCIEMLAHDVIAPYILKVKEETHLFSLIFATVESCLRQISQLHRASTLPTAEHASMIATIVHSRQSRVKFNPCWLEDLNENYVVETHGSRITPLVTNPGRIMLTSLRLYFQPYNNADPFPVLKLRLDKIKKVVKRRFLLRQVGLELFCSEDSKLPYLFFSLLSEDERDSFYTQLTRQPILNLDDSRQENMTLLWQNGVISNYDYLLYLNSTADRSFNDLAQYPVFPWVLADYTNPVLDLSNPESYRDLRKPVGALNEERLQKLKSRYKDMMEPKFLYGSHYSTPGFILYYLVRKVPQYMLCLQSGRFDQPDRMFNSVADTWKNITSNSSDFKEMIPEFYQPENKGDFLTNFMNLDFGLRQDGGKVSNVELPPWAKDPADFIQKLRDALESDIVSNSLHHWIDLIFGYKQQGVEANKADNVFFYLTYEGAVDLDNIREMNERYALEVQIMEFGQMPRQIFKQPHPARSCTMRKRSYSDKESKIPSFELSPGGNGQDTDRKHSISDEAWENIDQIEKDTSFHLHKDTIKAVCFSDDGRNLFTVSQDSLLKLYSLEEKRQQRSINICNMALSSLKLLSNGKSAFIGSWDNNVYTYNFEYGKITSTLYAHDDAVSDIIWNNGMLATASWDSTVKIWNYPLDIVVKRNMSEHLRAHFEHDSKVNSISLNPSNTTLLAGTEDGQVSVWDIATCSLLSQTSVQTSELYAVSFSPDGQRFVCGGGNGLQMFDINTNTMLFHTDVGPEIRCLKWDGFTVLAGTAQGSIMVWDLVNAKLLKNLTGHVGAVACLDVTHNGKVIATGGEDKTVTLWKKTN